MNSVTCIAPTKTFNLAGLQTAAVMVPDPVLRHKGCGAGLNTDEVAEPNAFAITAAVAAFTEGGPWLDELRAYLAGKQALRSAPPSTRTTRRSTPPAHVTLVEGDATYLLWLDCSALTDDTERLCDHLLAEQRLMLSPRRPVRAATDGISSAFNAATQRETRGRGHAAADGRPAFVPLTAHRIRDDIVRRAPDAGRAGRFHYLDEGALR